jgi:hypothetical protein
MFRGVKVPSVNAVLTELAAAKASDSHILKVDPDPNSSKAVSVVE